MQGVDAKASARGAAPYRQVPVSRATFQLSDREAFDAAVAASVAWISKTAASELPREANQGLDFSFAATDGRAEASALRLNDAEGDIWAARIDYRGDKIAGRTWITDLFVEQRKGSLVRFGAQLNCLCKNDDPGFDHSRPRVVREVIDLLAAEADGEALTNSFENIAEDQISRFVSFLYDPNRRLPIVTVSVDDSLGAQVDLDKLANRLSGTAHLRCLAIEPTYELSRLVGKRMSVFDGAIRIYMPGLEQETEDPFQHPLWLAPYSGWNPRAAGQISSRILPLGFRDADGDARFWRIGLLRQVASRKLADEGAGTQEDKLRAEIGALEAENSVLKEAAVTAESLMYEEASKVSHLQSTLAQIEEENFSLRGRIRSFHQGRKTESASIDADDLYTIFQQDPTLETSLRAIAAIFPDRVVILETAVESAEESYGFTYRKKAFDLLWSLCTCYWTALARGESDTTARQCLGSSYAAKESETLSKAGRRRRTFSYEGVDIEMERHLKIGVADNKTETLRIHFEWVANKRLIVIGYCGAHLDF